MKPSVNPFRQLYVGESIGPEEFVKLFSPVLVDHSLALFQPGNVVLMGLAGSGKSMLLNLLDPVIRIAYAKHGSEFPVPSEFRKFLGAGINLQTSGVSHFGNRPIGSDKPDPQITPIYFADFLNYFVVADLLASLKKLITELDGALADEIGISKSESLLDSFAKELSSDECWFGYLDPVKNFSDLQKQLSQRIVAYKSYINFNIDQLPKEITNTKTSIGVPISTAVKILRSRGVINPDVEVFVRIDQYEELPWLGDRHGLGTSYQEIVHSLLGMRDSNVSYRIGARHFAWSGEKRMYGTTAVLEKKRNYLPFDLDALMRRKEYTRGIFPKIAEDIFRRRLKTCPYYTLPKSTAQLLKKAFGPTLPPRESALDYFTKGNRRKAVDVEKNWPEPWKKFLYDLAEEDPLSARLGEAWARQKGKSDVMKRIPVKPYPWEKQYWKKERTEQALMQLASRNQQQMKWSGKEDILALSGGNILAFLSLCQHVWDVWLRDNRAEKDASVTDLPLFDRIIQSIGIFEASSDWYKDLEISERGGKERRKFITFLGILFFKKLSEDKAMSNPGHNGFSIELNDLDRNMAIRKFLNDCVDYGDLYDGPHTTKYKNRKKRWKYYLNPILSPYFKIPHIHTKEPIYVPYKQLTDWFKEAEVTLPAETDKPMRQKSSKTEQISSTQTEINFDKE